jgi:hypothetical protein
MLREGKWLCEGPKDEGNFVAKANGFARVRRTRATKLLGSSTIFIEIELDRKSPIDRTFEKYDASHSIYESFRKDWEILKLEKSNQ